MDIKKAFSDFYNELSLILIGHGFNFSKNTQQAIKKTNTGFYEIYFNTGKVHDYTYAIDLKLRIRCNIIQEIRGKITPYDAIPESITISFSTFKLLSVLEKPELNFEKAGGRAINFDNKISIGKWISGFKKLMNEAVFSFFENFQSIEDFDQWFNKPISENNYGFDAAGNWNNYVCGLIAAKLVKNNDYEKLYAIRMDDLITLKNEDGIKELQKIKQYLEEHYK